MKAEAVKEYFMINGDLKKVEESYEVFEKITTTPIYEVIRIVDGVPTFLEDHLERMFNSAKSLGRDLYLSEEEIRASIKEVILKNNVDQYNIKLISGEADGIGHVFLTYCVDTFFPPKEFYEEGIKTIIYKYDRDNPNVKLLYTNFKEEVAKILDERGAFEALLLRSDGYIPEGSRSNMFFVKEDKIYTAPGDEVLQGITRKRIFKIAEMKNLQIVEETIHEDDLKDLDGGFMTGTGLNILPISSVEDINIPSVNNKVVLELNEAYQQLTKDYIDENKYLWI